MNKAGSLLRVEDLTLSIRDLPILRDVSLALQPGKVLGIVGDRAPAKA
ncbi:hypothetical protein [Fodinicurvata halophila]